MIKAIFVGLILAASVFLGATMTLDNLAPQEKNDAVTKLEEAQVDLIHPFLYKIISAKDWEDSQQQKKLKLSPMDDKFIHLATEYQIDGILDKYWKNESRFVILKIQTDKLQGKLVFEANPGGINRYFHLYDGYIPFDSIVDGKLYVRK
jgi:uncharacterized protein (DUF952 family)